MSIRITDTDNVALYDSVTGLAFGETFQSAAHANQFLEFLAGIDARTLTATELAAKRHEWDMWDPAVQSDVTVYGAGSQ